MALKCLCVGGRERRSSSRERDADLGFLSAHTRSLAEAESARSTDRQTAMSQRYTQDRATTQRHLALLKDLLKQPDNKLCADCKRNDPRWASTNLGCWLCIRCSGHHRGMGVHISRVRSVDLDTWTPEQIEHMQRWGNRRANLYWEAHLKPGHMPPDQSVSLPSLS
jgi:hypothetical protein